MRTCTHCQKRKAKRRCPALGGGLCQLCCGILRERKLRCPDSCPYFVRHKTYQEERILHRKPVSPEGTVNDERMNWLAFHIEAPLKEVGERRPSFTDGDAVLALEYAKDRIEHGPGRLILPGQQEVRRNEAGEMVLQSLERCRYQRSIILPGSLGTYTSDEKRRSLENVILNVKHSSRGLLEGRGYLDNLIERFARIQESVTHKKMIFPSP